MWCLIATACTRTNLGVSHHLLMQSHLFHFYFTFLFINYIDFSPCSMLWDILCRFMQYITIKSIFPGCNTTKGGNVEREWILLQCTVQTSSFNGRASITMSTISTSYDYIIFTVFGGGGHEPWSYSPENIKVK